MVGGGGRGVFKGADHLQVGWGGGRGVVVVIFKGAGHLQVGYGEWGVRGVGVGGTIQRSRSLASLDTPVSVCLSFFLSFFFLLFVVVVVGLFGCLVGCLAIICLFICLFVCCCYCFVCFFVCVCVFSLQKRDQLLTSTKDHLGHVRVRWVTEASEYQHAVKVSVFNMLKLHGHYRLLKKKKKKKKKKEEEEEKKSQ